MAARVIALRLISGCMMGYDLLGVSCVGSEGYMIRGCHRACAVADDTYSMSIMEGYGRG